MLNLIQHPWTRLESACHFRVHGSWLSSGWRGI